MGCFMDYGNCHQGSLNMARHGKAWQGIIHHHPLFVEATGKIMAATGRFTNWKIHQRQPCLTSTSWRRQRPFYRRRACHHKSDCSDEVSTPWRARFRPDLGVSLRWPRLVTTPCQKKWMRTSSVKKNGENSTSGVIMGWLFNRVMGFFSDPSDLDGPYLSIFSSVFHVWCISWYSQMVSLIITPSNYQLEPHKAVAEVSQIGHL